MQEFINKEWMIDYEKNYSSYKDEWDVHYEQIRNFIHSCLPHKVHHWGFIGVTNTIPEIDSRILHRIVKITLLDINDEALKRARIYLSSIYDFRQVDVQRFDNTGGFTDKVLEGFELLDKNEISEKKLLDYLDNLDLDLDFEIENVKEKNHKYDFITHLGLMDYYMMPIFIKYCSRFQKNIEEFFQIMRKLNDHSVKISLKFLHNMLDKHGKLIISTPVARIPEGEPCNRSLFWLDAIENIIEESDFNILSRTEHIWNEFPTDDGHSHLVQNILCEKQK